MPHRWVLFGDSTNAGDGKCIGFDGWSIRGQSIGMMPFKFKVRDAVTSKYPSVGRALVRGFVWLLEVFLTGFLIGAIGWLWLGKQKTASKRRTEEPPTRPFPKWGKGEERERRRETTP